MPGEFSARLPTPTPNPAPQTPPTPDLGEIDPGLELSRSGNIITGHVNLDFTLVFTRERTVGTTAFGPYVEGVFDGMKRCLLQESGGSQQRLPPWAAPGGRVSGHKAKKSSIQRYWTLHNIMPPRGLGHGSCDDE